MKEQLPSPHFDSFRYERPNQKWVCGWASEGKPCRIGPGAGGECRATYECTPYLDLKPGEKKGYYKCTRPKEFGGPCQEGALPDGRCARPIPKCQPIRSVRSRRGIAVAAVIVATVGFLLIGLFGNFRNSFINPGEISAQHRSGAFARMYSAHGTDDNGCAACHGAARVGTASWMAAAFNAEPGPLEFQHFFGRSHPGMTSIDHNCQSCHKDHHFHQPNVLRAHSCSLCHREHQGGGAMLPPEDNQCLSCHGNAKVMEASAVKGASLPREAFEFRPALGRILFAAARPPEGFTQVFRSFQEDHPEFRLLSSGAKETNTLAFNHARHLSPDVAALAPGGLSCRSCHLPDASGMFHQKISYEKHCQSCHSLQFDSSNPELQVPHGDSRHLRAFLRSLPSQYAELARRSGITRTEAVDRFVQDQMNELRTQFGSGENLEQQLFFNSDRWGPVPQIGNLPARGRSRYPGCVFCHEVKAGDLPSVTPPAIPDRWMVRGAFNHSRHLQVDCIQCHNMSASKLTADIMLPRKESCVRCHSPAGGVRHQCATCHTFHTPHGKFLRVDAK